MILASSSTVQYLESITSTPGKVEYLIDNINQLYRHGPFFCPVPLYLTERVCLGKTVKCRIEDVYNFAISILCSVKMSFCGYGYNSAYLQVIHFLQSPEEYEKYSYSPALLDKSCMQHLSHGVGMSVSDMIGRAVIRVSSMLGMPSDYVPITGKQLVEFQFTKDENLQNQFHLIAIKTAALWAVLQLISDVSMRGKDEDLWIRVAHRSDDSHLRSKPDLIPYLDQVKRAKKQVDEGVKEGDVFIAKTFPSYHCLFKTPTKIFDETYVQLDAGKLQLVACMVKSAIESCMDELISVFSRVAQMQLKSKL